ncbi:MAG: hypothetical protein M3349_09045 [Actinomycetota bacterium]|nr:hypothetical protein [Actinomycetota bacterium]
MRTAKPGAVVPIRSRILLLVAAVVAMGALTACGGDDAEPDEVASISGDDADQGGGARQGIEDALLDFTVCLRDEGIEVPDIQLDAAGAPIIRPDDIAGIDLESPEVQAALGTCLPILTDAGAFSFADDPELQALLQDSLQDFAVCMRREGIDDFPDPDGSAAIPFPVTAFTDFTNQSFQDALEVCRRQVGIPGLGE